ncbi:MAG TPA: 2-epi-5-epi-valiolone synthase [Chloroflexi bacterium]|nr:2-epi-5-epi-valiolone synthase [Chloroflexota bacterium]
MTSDPQAWRVRYQRTIEYEIVNSPDLFDLDNTDLLYPGIADDSRRFVVIDSNVEKHFSTQIRHYFIHHGVEAKIVSFPGGEDSKTIDSYLSLVRELDSFPIHRRDEPIIMIGGGVLSDVTGFVASSYRRSVPHLKVPTTLMGYIDASIGIKTGINYNGYKNRIGSFEPPLKVLLDKSLLKTLPKRHILNGIAEIIKLAVIKDAGLFGMLEECGVSCVDAKFQDGEGGMILDRAITGMLEELEPNLFEEDLARKVDFGHTFSYGLEIRHEANLLHGEAVLLDIIFSSMIALKRCLISEEEIDRIFKLVETLGFKLNFSLLDPAALWQSLEERTCHRNGVQRVPLPHRLGECVFVNDIKQQEILSAHQALIHRRELQHDRIQ